MSDPIKFPAGEYYIGDLCYIGNDFWDEFCDRFIEADGKLCELHDGRKFWFSGTAFGDGTYWTSTLAEIGVDAGLIGIINVNDITPGELKHIDLGVVVKFDEPFSVWKAGRGEFYFGHIYINTGDEEVDDDYYPDYDGIDWHEEFYGDRD